MTDDPIGDPAGENPPYPSAAPTPHDHQADPELLGELAPKGAIRVVQDGGDGDWPVAFAGDYLSVRVLPQPEGGVRIKFSSTDREGVFNPQAEWTAWAESLPKRGVHKPSDEAVRRPATEQEAVHDEPEEVSTATQEPSKASTSTAMKEQSEAQTPTTVEKQPEVTTLPAPWECTPKVAAESSGSPLL